MTDTKQYITKTQGNGSVMISEYVIGTIVAHAVNEVEGVSGLYTASKKSWGKGLKIVISADDVLTIDCNIVVYFGQNIVEVANAVQEAVTGAVESMTGIKPAAINVNICGIVRK